MELEKSRIFMYKSARYINYIDCYLKILTFYCASSIYECQKESTTPVAKAWDGFYSIVYVFTYMNSRSLRLYDPIAISYDGYIENRMFQQ